MSEPEPLEPAIFICASCGRYFADFSAASRHAVEDHEPVATIDVVSAP